MPIDNSKANNEAQIRELIENRIKAAPHQGHQQSYVELRAGRSVVRRRKPAAIFGIRCG